VETCRLYNTVWCLKQSIVSPVINISPRRKVIKTFFFMGEVGGGGCNREKRIVQDIGKRQSVSQSGSLAYRMKDKKGLGGIFSFKVSAKNHQLVG
jgi:hypothetical protein